jgi:monofunctional glycosyltransferase
MIRWFFYKSPNVSLSVSGLIKRFLVLLISFVMLYQVWIFVHICWWIKFNPSTTSFMNARLSVMQEINEQAELKHKWVDYDKISNYLKRAVVASEDSKFKHHEGFDWEGIEAAYEKNLKKGKLVAGGSTISQQLAKNLFLSSSRTPWRKGEEVIITFMLEKMMTKRRILVQKRRRGIILKPARLAWAKRKRQNWLPWCQTQGFTISIAARAT